MYQSDGTTSITVPQGVYMQIRSSNFNSSLTDDAVIAPPAGLAMAFSGTYPVAVIHGLSGPTLAAPATYPIYSVP